MLIARLNGCGETSTRQLLGRRTPSRRRTPRDRRLLRVDRHRDVGRGGPCGGLGHERWQRLGQRAEDLLHARGRQPVVVVGRAARRRGGRRASKHAAYSRASSTLRSQRRCEERRSPSARVPSCQTAWPSAAACTRAAASSAGTRRWRSQSRRATRTTSRSRSLRSPSPSISSSHAPMSSLGRRARARGAAARRAAAPAPPRRAGGIIVRWSQAARRPSEERSASSASRSRRDSSADIRDRLRAAPPIRDPHVMDAAFHGFAPTGLRPGSRASSATTRRRTSTPRASSTTTRSAMAWRPCSTSSARSSAATSRCSANIATCASHPTSAPTRRTTYGVLQVPPAPLLRVDLSAQGLYAGSGYHGCPQTSSSAFVPRWPATPPARARRGRGDRG